MELKIHISKNRKKKTKSLSIAATKGELLEYAQAEKLKQLNNRLFLSFYYAAERRDEIHFEYEVTDMVALETYLKTKLSLAQFRAMLDDVIDCIEVCGSCEFDATRLLFEPKFLHLDGADNRLAFAYLPLQNLPGDRSTAMDALRFIAERAQFVCNENRVDAVRLLDYLKRQEVFSAVDFKEFLESTAFKQEVPRLAPSGNEESSQRGCSERVQARGEVPVSGLSTERESCAPVFDFIKTQTGAPSAQEIRAQQTLAEKVAFDVADAPSGATNLPQNPPADGEAPTSFLAGFVSPEKQTAANIPIDPFFALVRISNSARYALRPGDITDAGRSRQCSIHLTGNLNVSRIHAVFSIESSSCYVTDQGATNKTYVNDVAILPHVPFEIFRGAKIALADEEFVLE